MCQICTFDAVCSRYAWPVPVRPHITTLQDHIPAARDACHAFRTHAGRGHNDDHETSSTAKADVVSKVDGLYADLKAVSAARETWWQSKKELRTALREEIEHEMQTQNFKAATQGERAKQAQRTAREKYNELQAINTRASDRVTEMSNGLDMLCRSTLEMKPEEFANR